MAARQTEQTILAVIQTDMGYIQKDISTIKDSLQHAYVSVEKHNGLEKRVRLLERAIFTVIGLIVLGVLSQLLNGVLNK